MTEEMTRHAQLVRRLSPYREPLTAEAHVLMSVLHIHHSPDEARVLRLIKAASYRVYRRHWRVKMFAGSWQACRAHWEYLEA